MILMRLSNPRHAFSCFLVSAISILQQFNGLDTGITSRDFLLFFLRVWSAEVYQSGHLGSHSQCVLRKIPELLTQPLPVQLSLKAFVNIVDLRLVKLACILQADSLS